MIKVISCHCGSSDTLIRGRLSKFRYPAAATIPIVKGRDKSKSVLNSIPQFPEVNDIRRHLDGVTKWAILIGYDEDKLKWVDLANGTYLKNDVDAELLIKHFA